MDSLTTLVGNGSSEQDLFFIPVAIFLTSAYDSCLKLSKHAAGVIAVSTNDDAVEDAVVRSDRILAIFSTKKLAKHQEVMTCQCLVGYLIREPLF